MSEQALPYEQRNYAGYLWHALLLAGINLRLIALALIAFTLLTITRFSFTAGIIVIYLELILFTVSGAFAGISYVDIMGKSFTGDFRKKFFVRKQLIATVGILVSAVIAREVLKRMEYPHNFFVLFISASIVLLFASGGFWILREKQVPLEQRQARQRIGKTLTSIPGRLKSDSNLRNYIIICDLLGFSIVLLPFYIALAKTRYTLDPELIGNLLLIQIGGMVAANLVWSKIVRRRGFRGILYVFAGAGTILPWIALFISRFLPLGWYYPVFALSGILLSAQKITSDAVVVEITTDENRALYTGIIGTFNLSRALFPILIGSILSFTGYVPVFTAIGFLAMISTLFIKKLNCPVDRLSSEE